MNFLLDENFPKAAVAFLQDLGHNVFDVRGTSDAGSDDARVFDSAQRREAVLLTTDRDFYHTIPLHHPAHFGVVVVALRQPHREAILTKLGWLLKQDHLFPLRNKVVQLRDRTCRVRRS